MSKNLRGGILLKTTTVQSVFRRRPETVHRATQKRQRERVNTPTEGTLQAILSDSARYQISQRSVVFDDSCRGQITTMNVHRESVFVKRSEAELSLCRTQGMNIRRARFGASAAVFINTNWITY